MCFKKTFLVDPENEPVVKRKKVQCTYCLGSFTKQSLKKHEVNCENYQQLIENDVTCIVCKKTLGSRQAVNQHIGHSHKAELLLLEMKKK